MKFTFTVEVDIPMTPFEEGAFANRSGKGLKHNPYLFDRDKRYDWTMGWLDEFTKK